MNQAKRTLKVLLTCALAVGLSVYALQPASAQTPRAPDPVELALTIQELSNGEFQEVIIEFGGIAVLHLRSTDSSSADSAATEGGSSCRVFAGGCGCDCSDGSACVANGCGCGSECGCGWWGADAYCKCYRCSKATCEGGGGKWGGWGKCEYKQSTQDSVE